jgi:hypothetical protein
MSVYQIYQEVWVGCQQSENELAAGFQLLMVPRGKLFSCWDTVASPIEMRYLTSN